MTLPNFNICCEAEGGPAPARMTGDSLPSDCLDLKASHEQR